MKILLAKVHELGVESINILDGGSSKIVRQKLVAGPDVASGDSLTSSTAK